MHPLSFDIARIMLLILFDFESTCITMSIFSGVSSVFANWYARAVAQTCYKNQRCCCSSGCMILQFTILLPSWWLYPFVINYVRRVAILPTTIAFYCYCSPDTASLVFLSFFRTAPNFVLFSRSWSVNHLAYSWQITDTNLCWRYRSTLPVQVAQPMNLHE